MKVKLGRRRPLTLLPYSGKTFCGCSWVNGVVLTPCANHKTLKAGTDG